ncbi:UDP-N-acetylmuramoyl-L-alanyl-D-glutamate--2,6-diaminopimelate ligase [Methylacidiphilum caldifontis]|uniref:UDP-N-acetylmuramoyl-L-alanyl-D-glutamate--2,6-diaminopimelate ligase n=1 Tax=Methylacidiphilum caldifontis TaxID=2795386 RepID=A0A4Y8PFX6_9BACT|nr:UDP-N-acetylmuramoyl-L-alanyl-D-glutamate--2,6-diaminopimelate ligase [Methylacidiphilum caldifontis]TFE70808.1 UDP-N-acetylmuramoyl-L-alanyl-D-glutamate--2,6-diaminopimelate ligase [Methylacidiphilum caldifontis]
MKLTQLLSSFDPLEIIGNSEVEISSLCYDSRKVSAGAMFFAWKGEKTDGHLYIGEAIEKKAQVIVCSEIPPEYTHRSVTFVKVRDPRRVLGKVASEYYGKPSDRLALVGVTGTNGKTTTSFLIRYLLEKQGMKSGIIGTVFYDTTQSCVSSNRTSPEGSDLQYLLYQMVQAGCGAGVMEVSSHAIDQGRIEGTNFQVGIYTNLSQDHLDYHRTMEQYQRSKENFVSYIQGGQRNTGAVVINVDDPRWGLFAEKLRGKKEMITVSAEGRKEATLKASSILCDRFSTIFNLEWAKKIFKARSSLLGYFNVENTLLALGATLLLGFPLERSISLLETFPGVPGRMERYYSKDGLLAIIDYAHSEDALSKLLHTLRSFQPSRIILVVGCGGDRDRTKRPKMAKVASDLADIVLFTSDNPRSESPEQIFDDMRPGVEVSKKVHWIVDREEAIRKAIIMANSKDIVCVAGKGHESYQEIAGVFYPFNDRLVVEKLLKERSEYGVALD